MGGIAKATADDLVQGESGNIRAYAVLPEGCSCSRHMERIAMSDMY
jgi:hypothetical protein